VTHDARKNSRLETRAVHVGHEIDSGTGAVAPPIILSTTFARDENYVPINRHVYSRSTNPNRDALESALASLEGGTSACAFSSGQAATAAVLHALRPGDHVILPLDLYFGTKALLDQHYARWDVQVTSVDMTDPSNVQAALQPNTRLVWIETPSNPRLDLADIAVISEIAHSVAAKVVADNTWASPMFTRPLELGADIVMHSTTKYLGGHSDVLGGALICKEIDEFWDRLVDYRYLGGAVPSPFDCWLLLRSIPTLAIRARAQSISALTISNWLSSHKNVARVNYPGLTTHAQHSVALKQMHGGFGGMLSVEVKGGAQDALDVAKRVQLFTRATSLGGYESLIEHRFTVEGQGSVAPPSLLRLSVGLEHVDDLIEDLQRALA
jgi:cystathionine gamma-synthase